jgi:hypothetical protein
VLAAAFRAHRGAYPRYPRTDGADRDLQLFGRLFITRFAIEHGFERTAHPGRQLAQQRIHFPGNLAQLEQQRRIGMRIGDLVQEAVVERVAQVGAVAAHLVARQVQRDAEQPGRWFGQAGKALCAAHRFDESVLHHVFGIVGVAHITLDEAKKVVLVRAVQRVNVEGKRCDRGDVGVVGVVQGMPVAGGGIRAYGLAPLETILIFQACGTFPIACG